MLQRTGFILALLACSTLTLPATSVANPIPAKQNVNKAMEQAIQKRMTGKVMDVINTEGYTYAQVDTGKEKVWAVTTTIPVKKGDVITFSTAMPMDHFHSNSLNRDFPVVYFGNGFIMGKADPAAPIMGTGLEHCGLQEHASTKPVKGIREVKGGNTIAELYTDRQKLAGKTVRVRGKVTKFTTGAMGRNWLHIMDSSGSQDLTVTTSGTAAVDNVVVVKGKLALDKDYGFGYVYPVIVEGATVKKE
jgi:hypothetical protein